MGGQRALVYGRGLNCTIGSRLTAVTRYATAAGRRTGLMSLTRVKSVHDQTEQSEEPESRVKSVHDQ